MSSSSLSEEEVVLKKCGYELGGFLGKGMHVRKICKETHTKLIKRQEDKQM